MYFVHIHTKELVHYNLNRTKKASLSLSVFGSSLDQNRSHTTSGDGSAELSLAALDVATVRLLDAPEKARKLFSLLEQVSERSSCVFTFSSFICLLLISLVTRERDRVISFLHHSEFIWVPLEECN